MSTHDRTSPSQRFRAYLIATSGLVIVVGVAVLVGWRWNLPFLTTIISGAASMKPNTALGFVAMGLSLFLLHGSDRWRSQARGVSALLALFAVVLGGATIFEHITGWSLGFDDTLFPATLREGGAIYPGRFSVATAFCFACCGSAVLFQHRQTAGAAVISQWLGLAVTVVGLVALAGYTYGMSSLYRLNPFSTMALHTASLFVAIGVALVVARSEVGPAAVLGSPYLGGQMARRLLPAMFAVTFGLAWLRAVGERANLFSHELGLAWHAAVGIVFGPWVIWATARSLNRNEGALRELELKNRSLSRFPNENPNPVLRADREGRLQYANAGAGPLLDGVRRSVGELVVDAWRAVAEQAWAEGSPKEFTTRAGDRIYAMLAVPIPEADYVNYYGRDVTTLHQAESSLRESLRELRDVRFAVDQHAIVAITDPSGIITYANDRFCEISGYARAELVGQDHRIINSGHHPKKFFQDMWATISRGRVWRGEIKNRAKDGTDYWVDTTIVPFLTDGGQPRQYVAIRSDITARKAGELRSARLAAIVESSNDAIVGKDTAGLVTSWNHGAEAMFGYTAAEMMGRSIRVLVPDDRHAEDDSIQERILRGETIGSFDTVRVRKDGGLLEVSVAISPIKDPEGRVVGASKIVRDISVIRRLERAEVAKAAAEQASRAKDQFLGSMSHELRTPLNAVLGFTGTLLMRLPGPLNETQESQLRTIQSSAKHLLSLINDILDLARIEAGKMDLNLESVDGEAVLREVAATIQPAAEQKGLALAVEIPSGRAGEWLLSTDRRALVQILLNLASNAVKYTERGRVCLGLRREKGADDERLVFFVRDTGIGIRSEDRSLLFQPFSQVDLASRRRIEGVGLGLHVSQRLAEMLAGRIELESEYGVGSTFTLALSPAAPALQP